MKRATKLPLTQPVVRCAIYTRKSTEEGLEQEFNSLDAQRESGEAFIKSQAHEGWVCLPTRYDDGGFTGGNMDRPALKSLLADIEAGLVDVVVVYKVDRLSRSLLDFAKMMEAFDKHRVAFAAVTQQFNTASSMGRLVLNVLLSFAQFEREIISERTRDKIAAARRKGKWSGGHPILGYDVDPQGFKLVVNEDEAKRVRAIFALYLDKQSIVPTIAELDQRGWVNKAWTTRKGRPRGGTPFSKSSLHKMLTNVAYVGNVRYKSEVHGGEHAGIVEESVWRKVQTLLKRNGSTGGAVVRNKFGALLKGLLACTPCGCAMVPSHTTKNGGKRYRYYTCSNAQKRGWKTCPSKSVPAGEIERFVVDRIKVIGSDPVLMHETIKQVREQGRARAAELESERRTLDRDLGRWNGELRLLAAKGASLDGDGTVAARLADLHDRIRGAEHRAAAIRDETAALDRDRIDEREAEQALMAFDPVWDSLTPQERTRLVHLLVERVDYDGAKSRIGITFHPTGIKALAVQAGQRRQEIEA